MSNTNKNLLQFLTFIPDIILKRTESKLNYNTFTYPTFKSFYKHREFPLRMDSINSFKKFLKKTKFLVFFTNHLNSLFLFFSDKVPFILGNKQFIAYSKMSGVISEFRSICSSQQDF